MYLVIVWMTLIHLSFWYGRRERGTMGFWLLDVERDHYHNLCQVQASRTLVWSTSMQPLALVVHGISGSPQPVPLASAKTICEDCSVSMDIANQLQPLQHGIPCETHIQKKAKTTPQEVEVQPVADEKGGKLQWLGLWGLFQLPINQHGRCWGCGKWSWRSWRALLL